MDVEGWEDRALLGAIETIARFKVQSPAFASLGARVTSSPQPALFFESESSAAADLLPFSSVFVEQQLQPLGYSCRLGATAP
jgi:hypothetical protein